MPIALLLYSSCLSDNTSHIGDDDNGGGTDQTITPVKTALAHEPGNDLNSPESGPGGMMVTISESLDFCCNRVL